LRERFGSRDYREAGAMRPTFSRVVNENQTDSAQAIRCPVVLVHGDGDTESRPEIAERLHRLIRGSRLHVLRGFDHWNILTDGRHQVLNLLDEFARATA
jgi:pimeloyl-ACP methyl ester carboxylesterase